MFALAALAATASFAQSSVTLYGKANIGFGSTNGSKTAMLDQPDGSGSRWGVKGTEDLGGGLTANFQLESGFNVNDGKNDKAETDNYAFQRGAWASLKSASLGEVRLGRQYTVGFDGSIGTMPSTYADSALAVGLGFNGMGSRNSDMIKYISPAFNGFTVSASTQLAGDITAGGKTSELGLAYANGPLTVNLTGADVAATTAGLAAAKPWGANASYNFGVASATLGYVDTNRTGNLDAVTTKQSTTGKGYVAKINVPMGAHALWAGYAKNSTSDVSAYELGDYYSLSKRTRLYAIYANGSNDLSNGAAKPEKTNGKRVAVGVTHAF